MSEEEEEENETFLCPSEDVDERRYTIFYVIMGAYRRTDDVDWAFPLNDFFFLLSIHFVTDANLIRISLTAFAR